MFYFSYPIKRQQETTEIPDKQPRQFQEHKQVGADIKLKTNIQL